MPKIVKAHTAQTVTFKKFWKSRCQIIHLRTLAHLNYKHKAVVFVVVTVAADPFVSLVGEQKGFEGTLRESWQSTFGGSRNSNKIAVLEEGLKFSPISISPNEAQFLETRKFQINEIARIFRVPPHMIGDLEKSSFSNIEQQSLEFVKYTLDPWVIRWEQSIHRSLLTDEEKKTHFFKFNVEGLLRGDYQSRMSGYAVGIQNGFMSPNDVRELENLDLIPDELGGNLYLTNGNMCPLAMAGAAYRNSNDKEESDDEEILEVEESGGRIRKQ